MACLVMAPLEVTVWWSCIGNNMKYALIQEDRVYLILTGDTKPELHPEIVLVAIPDDAEVSEGDLYDPRSGKFTKHKLISSFVIDLRQAKLAESDWMMFEDSPLTPEQRIKAKAYRQILRDITKQPGYPDNVIWPDYPI